MRAILLSAGLGQRLRPLTETMPKCLVPINGIPLLQIWLENLIKSKVGPFLINTHHLSSQVEHFINSGLFKDQVSLVHEPKLLGTAGTLLRNIDFFKEQDGMLIHADNYCLADFSSFILAHKNRPHDCLMTMMTFQTGTPSSCGILELDHRGVVVGFHEKVESPPSNLANGAIYILSNQLLQKLKGNVRTLSDFSLDVIPELIGRIYTYKTSEVFIDIGTSQSYKKANNLEGSSEEC